VLATPGNGENEYAPTWSPDGAWLAFYQPTSSSLNLLKVRPGAGEPPVLLAKAGGAALPEWSPTGEWIAYHDENWRPKLISPDGKTTRALPPYPGAFAWAPDGKTLYQARLDPPALFAIDIAAGRDRKLRDLAGLQPYSSLNPGLRASLTADGKSVIYTILRPRQEIWILEGVEAPRPWWRSLLP
jgi:dipeptidyl aminopeptidase/acylaminoacyl peptidase